MLEETKNKYSEKDIFFSKNKKKTMKTNKSKATKKERAKKLF